VCSVSGRRRCRCGGAVRGRSLPAVRGRSPTAVPRRRDRRGRPRRPCFGDPEAEPRQEADQRDDEHDREQLESPDTRFTAVTGLGAERRAGSEVRALSELGKRVLTSGGLLEGGLAEPDQCGPAHQPDGGGEEIRAQHRRTPDEPVGAAPGARKPLELEQAASLEARDAAGARPQLPRGVAPRHRAPGQATAQRQDELLGARKSVDATLKRAHRIAQRIAAAAAAELRDRDRSQVVEAKPGYARARERRLAATAAR
jgi:hypothetical protein